MTGIQLRAVDWAVGVFIPLEADEHQESLYRRAYETGLRHGKEKVAGPIIDALELESRFGGNWG